MTIEPADDATERTPPTVYLHIGTMKTGTSFLQHVFQRNVRILANEGVLYPLDEGAWALQVRAARDILDIKGRPAVGSWGVMHDEILAWPGRAAIVSMEFYSLADDEKTRRVVANLAPSPIKVIITARDLARVMSSAWQSMIKQGHQWPFPDFVTAVRSGESDAESYRRFWLHHDLPSIVQRWADAVGPENVYLVTVPPSSAPPSLLWERVCSVVGLDAVRYDISQDKKSNFSLSYSDTEFMRQISERLRPELDRLVFKRWATRYFANRVLRASASARTVADRPLLSTDTQRWATERSHEMVAAIEPIGVNVVGDLEDLVPRPADTPDSEDAVKPQQMYPERAVMIIAALLKRVAELDPESASATDLDDSLDDDELEDEIDYDEVGQDVELDADADAEVGPDDAVGSDDAVGADDAVGSDDAVGADDAVGSEPESVPVVAR